jgi:rSAM/selenodomain-associated transferase 2
MLSVIIPVGPGEVAWRDLLADLISLRESDEIVLVAARKEDVTAANELATVRWVVDRPGRARQLNTGVRHSLNPWLWFLHADTRLGPRAIAAAQRQAQTDASVLGYFELAFLDDGPRLMAINALGVWLRCRLFGLPFGDQAFLLSRSLFERIGPYDETLARGEDHALVWAAHRAGVPVRSLGARVRTSARRYAEHGWAHTTLLHLCLTYKQAAAQRGRPRIFH